MTLTKNSFSKAMKADTSKSQTAVPSSALQKINTDSKQLENNVPKLLNLFSKLHLGVLVSLQAYKSMELNQELFSFGDLYILAKVLNSYFMQGHKSDEVAQVLSTCVDRLAQVIQVSLQTRSLHGKFSGSFQFSMESIFQCTCPVPQ